LWAKHALRPTSANRVGMFMMLLFANGTQAQRATRLPSVREANDDRARVLGVIRTASILCPVRNTNPSENPLAFWPLSASRGQLLRTRKRAAAEVGNNLTKFVFSVRNGCHAVAERNGARSS